MKIFAFFENTILQIKKLIIYVKVSEMKRHIGFVVDS